MYGLSHQGPCPRGSSNDQMLYYPTLVDYYVRYTLHIIIPLLNHTLHRNRIHSTSGRENCQARYFCRVRPDYRVSDKRIYIQICISVATHVSLRALNKWGPKDICTKFSEGKFPQFNSESFVPQSVNV
ncbi:predicted protein [Arabidopsis lyrata subsp. lyrata]|uniref:Predicted protein n=1 Tax=Arabidopsis lyrata subsp. lyrata TaxID=81972 RepID=D7MPV5_ARALL|nr:predicted protein [Arabidopsis lyrata subsp. lyrata]